MWNTILFSVESKCDWNSMRTEDEKEKEKEDNMNDDSGKNKWKQHAFKLSEGNEKQVSLWCVVNIIEILPFVISFKKRKREMP